MTRTDEGSRVARTAVVVEAVVVFIPVLVTWTRLYFAAREYLDYIRPRRADKLGFFPAWLQGFDGGGETFASDARLVVITLLAVVVVVGASEAILATQGRHPVGAETGEPHEQTDRRGASAVPDIEYVARLQGAIRDLQRTVEGLGSRDSDAIIQRLLRDQGDLANRLDSRLEDLGAAIGELVREVESMTNQLAEVAVELKQRELR